MSDFGPSPTHPLGWTFLGSGAALWVLPMLQLLGVSSAQVLPQDTTLRIAVLVIAASATGILLEEALSPLERILLKTLRFEGVGRDAWALAWQTRWKYPISDAEFRRHEALASFGRAYIVHFAFGAALWAWLACRQDAPRLALASLAAGLILAFTCYSVWRRHTGLITRLVLSAAKWREGKQLD
jgi:hypothetical protein